jgi:hypothetical protein
VSDPIGSFTRLAEGLEAGDTLIWRDADGKEFPLSSKLVAEDIRVLLAYAERAHLLRLN